MSATCHNCGQAWPRHPVLEVACPSCHAPIGSWCKRPSGHKAQDLHVEREQLALDAGVLQMCQAGPSARAARQAPAEIPTSPPRGQATLF